MPFAWGRNDCCTFAAGAVEAMTGEDPAAAFSYHTLAGAVTTLREITGRDDYAEGLACLPDALGFARVAVLCAQRGDLVLVPPGQRDDVVGELVCELVPALGVVSLNGRLAVAPGLEVLRLIPVAATLAAWKV